MKIRNFFILLSFTCCSTAVLADDWSFANTSFNHLQWSGATLEKSNKGPFAQKKSFSYIEFEGGMGGDWGDLYGFVDVENPHNNNHNAVDSRMNRRFASKAVARFKLTQVQSLPLMLYAHVYDFRDDQFFDQNRVLGLGTNLSYGNFWIHPFIGMHQELKSNIGAGSNGGMAGYVMAYDFKIGGESFGLSQWHETEFARKSSYLQMADSGSVVEAPRTAQNGALMFSWKANKAFSASVSYRYALNKLGTAGYQSAYIYTAKYNFK